MDKIVAEDISLIAETKIDWNKLKKRNILITGATGLIGYNLVTYLCYLSQKKKLDLNIYAHIRNKDKALKVFGPIADSLNFVIGDITETIQIEDPIHLIVHAASQTSSKAFVQSPIETIKTALQGTMNVMEFAKKCKAESVLFLSTMEIYGSPATDEKIDEFHHTNINTMSERSCYPESKRMCENIAASYFSEYGIPVKVIRLTQTIGPGVSYNDSRVFAEFARCAIEKKDIILRTKGKTKRSYLYSGDAINAIITVLLCDKNGEAFNAANEDTYCSIFEMARIVAEKCCNREIIVKIEEQDNSARGYAPELHMNLDTRKLQTLGWRPTRNLEDMFNILIEDMRKDAPNV